MEEAAFEQIAPQLRDKAMSTARAYGLDEMTADDAAQETMLKLWNIRGNLDRYRSLEALTVVITRHLITDRRRKKQTVSLPDDAAEWLLVNENTPQEQLESMENDKWLQKQLTALPSKQQTILRLRQVEHRSYEEIARILDIETTSARTLIARARKSLLEEFKKRMKQ